MIWRKGKEEKKGRNQGGKWIYIESRKKRKTLLRNDVD